MVNIAHVYNPQSRRLWWALVFFCTSAFLFVATATANTLTASVDRTSVSVGESFTLSLQFQGGSPTVQPQLPQIDGAQLAGTPSRAHSIQIINGQTSEQSTFDYPLVATKVGEFTIPAISVTVGGQNLTTQPIKFTVTKAPVADATQADGTPSEVFAKLVLPKAELYFGEIIPAEVRLYFQNIRDVHLPEVTADGFSMTPINQRPEQSQVQLSGRVYNLAVFKFTLSPVKTGSLKVGPARVSLAVLTEPRRDFFGQTVFTRARQTVIATEEVPVRVLPLPAQNKPANFSGAIGQFTMQASASPSSVSVGDPITVRVEISGRGALESLQLPEQPAWRDFKSYTPSSKVETQDALGLQGTKVFELVVSPQNAAIKELPPFEFNYFDPERKQYQVLKSPSTPLQVRASAHTPQPTVVSGQTSAVDGEAIEAKEIVHIKPQIGTIVSPGVTPLYKQPVFWIAQGIPPALWVAAFVYRRRKESVANNPRLRRQKEVEQIIARDLQKLREYAAANKSDDFFATVFRLLQEQIGERLNVAPSGITEAVVDTELRRRGFAQTELLHSLFQTCNQARYAPVRGSHELSNFIPKVEQALAELKKLNDEPAVTTA